MRRISTTVADAASHVQPRWPFLAARGRPARHRQERDRSCVDDVDRQLHPAPDGAQSAASARAGVHLKIDELVLSKTGTRNKVAGIAHKSEGEIEELRAGRDDGG
jgi:hypothetical protein